MGLITDIAREGMAKWILEMIGEMPDNVTKEEIMTAIQKILDGDLS